MRAAICWSVLTAFTLSGLSGCANGLAWPSAPRMPTLSSWKLPRWGKKKPNPNQYVRSQPQLPSARALSGQPNAGTPYAPTPPAVSYGAPAASPNSAYVAPRGGGTPYSPAAYTGPPSSGSSYAQNGPYAGSPHRGSIPAATAPNTDPNTASNFGQTGGYAGKSYDRSSTAAKGGPIAGNTPWNQGPTARTAAVPSRSSWDGSAAKSYGRPPAAAVPPVRSPHPGVSPATPGGYGGYNSPNTGTPSTGVGGNFGTTQAPPSAAAAPSNRWNNNGAEPNGYNTAPGTGPVSAPASTRPWNQGAGQAPATSTRSTDYSSNQNFRPGRTGTMPTTTPTGAYGSPPPAVVQAGGVGPTVGGGTPASYTHPATGQPNQPNTGGYGPPYIGNAPSGNFRR